jgi:hypothetical protein
MDKMLLSFAASILVGFGGGASDRSFSLQSAPAARWLNPRPKHLAAPTI